MGGIASRNQNNQNRFSMTRTITSEFQVNKPNGDILFVKVYDLTPSQARDFLDEKYPDCKISLYKTDYKKTELTNLRLNTNHDTTRKSTKPH